MIHTTFCRFEDVIQTIESFRNKPQFRMYISDTGAMTFEKMSYYKSLEEDREGHKYYMIPWDVSPAITRNYMIDRMEEQYVWKVDDDFIYKASDMDAQKIVDLLKEKKDLGLIGMRVASEVRESPFIYNIRRDGDVMRMEKPRIKREFFYNMEFYYCDVTPDCWIAKKEIFPEANYDEQYHVAEGLHTDFFLHLKYNTNWKVAYTPTFSVHHTKWEEGKKIDRQGFYHRKRFRSRDKHTNQINREKFYTKWKVKDINKL